MPRKNRTSRNKTHIQINDSASCPYTLCGLKTDRRLGITVLGRTYARLCVSPRFPKCQSYMCRTCVRNLFL